MAAAVLDILDEAMDRLAALDPVGLEDADLHDAVVAVQRARARLGVLAGRLLHRWDARRVWAGDGSRSAAARLARETACSPVSAAVELRRARQLPGLPATADSVAGGDLSLDHLDLLGRANRPHRAACFARDEPLLVEQGTRLRYAQAARMVGYWCQRADADVGGDEHQPAHDAHLHAATTIAGAVVVDGVLDPCGGAAFLSELTRLERTLFLADGRDGVVRTAAQRRAAALVVMAERSSAMSSRRPARPLFTVLVGDRAFTELCELSDGTVLTPRHLAPWLNTADLETVLFDGPSTVIAVTRRRRFLSAVRRAIEVRDRHCQHPAGCDVPADLCDVDHIVPYHRGGLTSQFNGRLECSTHNRHNDRHDHDAIALPCRPVTRLDEIRARLRWRIIHEETGPERPPPNAIAAIRAGPTS